MRFLFYLILIYKTQCSKTNEKPLLWPWGHEVIQNALKFVVFWNTKTRVLSLFCTAAAYFFPNHVNRPGH